MSATIKPTHFCSFCGKSNHEVVAMVSIDGDGATICDECVQICTEIIADFRKTQPTPTEETQCNNPPA